jgi:hypothetical protein
MVSPGFMAVDSYSLLIFWMTLVSISSCLWCRTASDNFLASSHHLLFQAFRNCLFVDGKGTTQLYCLLFGTRPDSVVNCLPLSNICSVCGSSAKSLGIMDMPGISISEVTFSGSISVTLHLRLLIIDQVLRVSMYTIKPYCNPMIDAIHQTV